MANRFKSEYPRYRIYLEERTQRIYDHVKESDKNSWMEDWDIIRDMDLKDCCTSEIMALINYCVELGNNASNILWSIHLAPKEE